MDEDFNPIEYLHSILQPVVDEVNQMIETMDGEPVEEVTAEDFYLPLVEDFVKNTTTMSLPEYVTKANPELAIELGLLTKREAIRDGIIPLTKKHVLDGYVGIKELPRELIAALNFTEAEYKDLNYG